MRGFWFAAGAGVGVYAVLKARRAAEAFTPEGVQDRLSALAVGINLFSDEVRAGMTEKETELRERLGLTLDGRPHIPELSLTAAEPGLPGPTDHGDSSQ